MGYKPNNQEYIIENDVEDSNNPAFEKQMKEVLGKLEITEIRWRVHARCRFLKRRKNESESFEK